MLPQAQQLQDMGDGFDLDGLGRSPPPPWSDEDSDSDDVLRHQSRLLVIGVLFCFPICFWVLLCIVARRQLYDASPRVVRSWRAPRGLGVGGGGAAPPSVLIILFPPSMRQAFWEHYYRGLSPTKRRANWGSADFAKRALGHGAY